jgi:hypothetical protein
MDSQEISRIVSKVPKATLCELWGKTKKNGTHSRRVSMVVMNPEDER